MTPERVRELVAAGDRASLVSEFAPLTEKQRRALYAEVGSPGGFKSWYDGDDAALLVELACGAADDVRDVWMRSSSAAVVRVVADRDPRWLAGWLAAHYANEWCTLPFEFVALLVRAGAIERPEGREFLQYFARAHTQDWRNPRENSKSVLRSMNTYPEWIDETWKLFDVESEAFAWGGWTPAVITMAGDGRMERQRLLDACLLALSNDFKSNTLSGVIDLYARLEPTTGEVVARGENCLGLLAVRTARVVAFAMRELRKVERAGALDAPAFLRAAPRLFSLRTKGPCTQALAMTKRILTAHPELRSAARDVAFAALHHDHRDVQAAALALDLVDDETLRKQDGDLPPTLRQGQRQTSALEDPRPRADALPEPWRTLAGVNAALNPGWYPAPLAFGVVEVPVLSCLEPIVPIATLDELIDAVAHAAELTTSGDEVERILDGISRLCAERPADFEMRTAPLWKRLKKLEPDEFGRGLTTTWAVSGVERLLAAWLRPGESLPEPWGRNVGCLGIATKRLAEIEARVRKRKATPLVAAPTHTGGWIDPRLIVAGQRGAGRRDRAWAKQRLSRECDDRAFAWRVDRPGEYALLRVRQSDADYRHLANAPWAIDWAATFSPADISRELEVGAQAHAARGDAGATSMYPMYPWVRLLAPADRPWGGRAVLVAAIAFVGNDADARGTAMDVMIDAVRDGRAHPVAFGDTLARMAAHGWMPPGRLGKSLMEVAAVSPSHTLFAARTGERFLANVETPLPRGSFAVLAALLELLTELGLPLDNRARPALDGVCGSSKTAKLCRALLDHAPSAPAPAYASALHGLALGRIERAERWAAWPRTR